MAHILISGCNGALGQALVEYILQHTTHHVIGFGRTASNLNAFNNLRFTYTSISMEETALQLPLDFIEADVLIYLAWQVLMVYRITSHIY